MIRIRSLAPGPVMIVLYSPETGDRLVNVQRWEDLQSAIQSPFAAHPVECKPDELCVSGGACIQHGPSVHVEAASPPVDFAAEKAARHAALMGAWAAYATPEVLDVLLRDVPVNPRRQASLDWLRATPAEQWPPVTVRFNGHAPVLTGGCHRVATARTLGMKHVRALVYVGQCIAYEGPAGV